MRDIITAAHRQRAHRDSMNAGDPRAAGGGADGGVGITVHILESLGRQLVDVWRVCMGIAVAAHPVNVIIFAGEPEDVRPVSCDTLKCSDDEGYPENSNLHKVSNVRDEAECKQRLPDLTGVFTIASSDWFCLIYSAACVICRTMRSQFA
jgi:hypothetical protein